MRFIEQKNQEKQIVEQEQREANDAVQQAQQIFEALDREINTLRSQLAQFIQENNQLEEQCRQATNNLEETKYANFEVPILSFVLLNSKSFSY